MRDLISLIYFCLDWALPDQLVCATSSALLQVAREHPQYRSDVSTALAEFASVIVSKLRNSDRE